MIQKKIRIGDILIEKGFISQEQLKLALKEQKESNFAKKLGQYFIDEGYISERAFAEILAQQLDIEFIDFEIHSTKYFFVSTYLD